VEEKSHATEKKKHELLLTPPKSFVCAMKI